MGFMDKLADKITNKVEDNLSKKAEDCVDKAMDEKAIKQKVDDIKEQRAHDSALSDTRKCPGCGALSKSKFCGECGKDLSDVQFLTNKELEKQ